MDYIRTCYPSRMKLDPNSDVLTPGRWHFCSPGAKPVPYPHAFASRNWDSEKGFVPVVGEVSRGGFSRGRRNPRLLGLGVCGGPDVWAGLPTADRTPLPVDEDGVPSCCPGLPLRFWGAAAGGRATQGSPPPPLRGGGLGGGSAVTGIALGTACSDCPDGSTAVYDLVVSGVGDLICPECVDLNGTYRLTWDADCSWSCPVTICGDAGFWRFDQVAGGGVLELFIAPGPTPTVGFHPSSDWDCLGFTTLALGTITVPTCDWSSAVLTIRARPQITSRDQGGGLGGGSSVADVPLDQHQGGGGLGGGSSSPVLPPVHLGSGGGLGGGLITGGLGGLMGSGGGLGGGRYDSAGLIDNRSGGGLGGGTAPWDTSCGNCPGGIAYNDYVLFLSGFADDTCDCSGFVGSRTLHRTGVCTYTSDSEPYCPPSGLTCHWELSIGSVSGQLDLIQDGGGGARAIWTWGINWDCQSALTLNLFSSTSECVFPLTLTLLPG